VASPAEDTVLHLYGVVAKTPAAPLPSGVGGAPVSVEDVADLSVLVSTLDAAGYGPEVWRDRGQDPGWLAQVATEHHAVLQAVIEETDVLPLRLPGVYVDREAVERALSADADALRSSLDAVRGRVEVAVKVFLRDADPPPGSGESDAPRSGRDYLARKAAEKSGREEARERRRQAVVDLHQELTAAATQSVVSPAQDASLSGRPEPMLLNAAHLVARDDLDEFARLGGRLAERAGAQGLSVELSGPWPPYSFTSPAGAQAGAS